MSQIKQFNDTGHIRNQTAPVGAVVGDLMYLDSTGWHLRTSTSNPIDGYLAVADGTTSVVCVGNGLTVWKGGNAVGNTIYEDITNPAKTTITSGGRVIGKVKGSVGGNLAYEGDSFLIECFGRNAYGSMQEIATPTGVPVDGIEYVVHTFAPRYIEAGSQFVCNFFAEINTSLITGGGYYGLDIDIGDGTGGHALHVVASYFPLLPTNSTNIHEISKGTTWIVPTSGTYSPQIKFIGFVSTGTFKAEPHIVLNSSWK